MTGDLRIVSSTDKNAVEIDVSQYIEDFYGIAGQPVVTLMPDGKLNYTVFMSYVGPEIDE